MNYLNCDYRDVSALGFIIVFWLGMFLYTGTFTSGYHFIDDHEIIQLNEKLNTSSFAHVAKNYLQFDSNWRFRPFWALHRVMEVKMFGTNFQLWACYTVLLCLMTSFLLYKSASLAGFSLMQSLLFVFLTLVNPAAIIWCQIADSENIGMFVLSVSLFLGAFVSTGKRNNFFFRSGFILSLLILPLCKESFTLVVPAVLFMYLWLYSVRTNLGICNSFKQNKLLVIVPLLYMTACIAFIILRVGTSKIVYAGVNESMFSTKIIFDFFASLFTYEIFYLILLGILIILIREFLMPGIPGFRSFSKKLIGYFLNLFVLSALVIIPQFAIYYKSGIRWRYYVPFMLGFSVVVTYLMKIIFDSKRLSKFSKYTFVCLTVVLIIQQTLTYALPDVMIYNNERRAMTAMLSTIEVNTDNYSNILVVMDPVMHWGYGRSLFIYLNNSGDSAKMNFSFIKIDTVHYPYNDTALYRITENYTMKYFRSYYFDSTKSTNDISCIAMFPGLEEKFLLQHNDWFVKDNFDRYYFDEYIVYLRKSSRN